MRAGARASAPPAPPAPLVSCLLCGRSFVSMRAHTVQVPRHLPRPKVALHRRCRWLRSVSWLTISPVGDLGDLAVALPAVAAAVVPAWIPAGDWILDRVPGDFPDDVVFSASVDGFTLWVKSSAGLAGPWDWIVTEGPTPLYFGGPYATRDADKAALVGRLAELLTPASPPDDLLSVAAAAATDEHAADVVLPRPTARGSVQSCTDHVTGAAGRGTEADSDPELLGLALDLAIVALRRARARLPARLAA
jgi:hypothetical protein